MFSDLVIAYLFCGGTGAGLLVTLSVLGLVRTRRRVLALQGAFLSRAWLACLAILAFSIALLAADLGRPDRAPLVLGMPHLTAITIGSVFLGASCLVALAMLLLLYRSRGAFSSSNRALVAFLLVAGIVCGLCVAGYTGVLLSSLPSVLAWQTPLVPLLFVCSSLSCGISLALGLLASLDGLRGFAEGRACLSRPLMRVDSCLVAAELVLLACYVLWCASGPSTIAAAQSLVSGSFAARFWFCLVAVGLVVPLVLELLCLLGRKTPSPVLLTAICVCILVGGAFLRWCVVGMAAFDPSQVAAAMSSYIPLPSTLVS